VCLNIVTCVILPQNASSGRVPLGPARELSELFIFSDPLGFSRDKNGKEWTANLGEKGREGKGGKDGQGTKVEA